MKQILALITLCFLVSTASASKEVQHYHGERGHSHALPGGNQVGHKHGNSQPGRIAQPPKQEKPAEQPEQAGSCKLEGKVIRVADGDSITVLDSQKTQHKIRLAGIDAPERGQPFGKAAGKFLSALVAGKAICVDWYKTDKYRRKVAVIRLGDMDVNLQIVNAGYAWHFKKYQREQSPEDRALYAAAHEKARAEFKGLWSEPDPIEPDEWRAGKRPARITQAQKAAVNQQKRQADQSGSAFSCGGKRYCKHMSSCAEACFHLNQCGLSRLDRDNDGIPCESFCGGC